jgi:3D (Asp-Asp-Asp) domain-containing protein
MKLKKIDEDKIIDILAVIFIFAIIFFAMWLISVPKVPNYTKVEETTQIVENSVESVEKCVPVLKETQPAYTEKEMVLTAYCSCAKCCGKSDGITATGTLAKQGRTIAVDPRYIPYGTEVIIDGVTYIAEDCGGVIKGDRIDVFFSSHEQALSFGRQTKIVRVIE